MDLGDAVAEELEILFEQIYLEMIYRGIAVLKKVRYALCPMPYALCP